MAYYHERQSCIVDIVYHVGFVLNIKRISGACITTLLALSPVMAARS